MQAQRGQAPLPPPDVPLSQQEGRPSHQRQQHLGEAGSGAPVPTGGGPSLPSSSGSRQWRLPALLPMLPRDRPAQPPPQQSQQCHVAPSEGPPAGGDRIPEPKPMRRLPRRQMPRYMAMGPMQRASQRVPASAVCTPSAHDVLQVHPLVL